jgi:gluconolactonase
MSAPRKLRAGHAQRGLGFVLMASAILSALPVNAAEPEPHKNPPPAGSVTAVRLLTVPQYTEGVVFDRDGIGYISHGKTIGRFTLDGKHEIWAETGAPNGHKILADGSHLVCDTLRRAVLRLSKDGNILGAAASEFEGKPLLGPNDLTIDFAHGGFYFTDPEGSDATHRIGAVYYVDAFDGTGHLQRVDDGMAYPNGIVLTPDGKHLYVDESLTNQVHIYDVLGPGKLSKRRVFADLPKMDKSKGQIGDLPDGMCLDAWGNLYVAHFGMGQVEALNPEGKLIASYTVGNLTTSNVAFGGPGMEQLFVTGGLGEIGKSEGAVFRLDLGVKGQRLLPKE